MNKPSADSPVDPLYQEARATFDALLEEVRASGDREPTAMTLSTLDPDGRLSARIVLLKGADARGFRFFTNYDSAKGRALAAHPEAALCFHWKMLREQIQVRVEGAVERLSDTESDAYFASRPRGSQLGAWASLQSQTLPDRATFEARYAEVDARYADREVPRPPHWGGYVVRPRLIEFWYGAKYRLHDRVRYERDADRWSKRLLYP